MVSPISLGRSPGWAAIGLDIEGIRFLSFGYPSACKLRPFDFAQGLRRRLVWISRALSFHPFPRFPLRVNTRDEPLKVFRYHPSAPLRAFGSPSGTKWRTVS